MTLRNIENAKKIMDQLNVLTAEIIAIEKFAIETVSGENGYFKISLELRKKQPNAKNKKPEDSAKIIHRQFMDSMYSMIMPMPSIFGKVDLKSSESTVPKLDFEVIDTEMMQVLGLMIMFKNKQRTVLLAKLKRMGVKL